MQPTEGETRVVSHGQQCLQLIEPEFGPRRIWQVEQLWPIQSISSRSPSQLSPLKHNQVPDRGKTRQRVRIDLSTYIAPAYTGAQQEIKNS